jgi:beta-glucosidase
MSKVGKGQSRNVMEKTTVERKQASQNDSGIQLQGVAEDRPPYRDVNQPLEARVDDLLSRLTFEEKLSLVIANSKFTTAALPRVGLPERWLSDGPHGVREDVGPHTWDPAGHTDDFATYMPVSMALASTWNPEMARVYAGVIGREARKRGKDIMLGPGVNIVRTPLCGRNHEYLGEDPYLISRMAVAYIQGEQAEEVASCVKHFAANNQEWERNSINVEMDERTLREIYLPAFEAAVKEGGVLTVMGAYNKFRGQYCCHNDYLLNQILKGEWGFTGLVVSDWAGTYDTREAALNGLDLEMGTDKPYEEFYLSHAFREGLLSGEFPMEVLDDKARRNLRVMLATGALEGRSPGAINTPEHQETARLVAEEGIVLLKNEGAILPLDPSKLQTIAVIGENAVLLHGHGGESARIKAFYEISPLEGIVRRVGDDVNVLFSRGYRQPDRSKVGSADAAGVDKWETKSTSSQEEAELSLRAVQAAGQADVVIYLGGLNHNPYLDTEGVDRRDMTLPYGQDELLTRVVEANPNTVVVLFSGAPVEMGSWLEQTPAVVQAWYPGMEGGNALARILFGDVNPSGKLPCTFPKRLEDSPAHALGNYPGQCGTVRYEEGLLVGYRWFDTKEIDPLFAFGHGLSYTQFEYSDLRLTEQKESSEPLLSVEFDITNVGAREGGEVAQVYVHDVESSLPRPNQELKAFQKVFLQPGEKRTIRLALDFRAFAFYDPEQRGWLAEEGNFTIRVGSSSRDIRLSGTFHLGPP